jgi:hypothetical protein
MRFEISKKSIQNNLGLLRREGGKGNNNNKFTEQSFDFKKVEKIIITKCTVDRVMIVKQLCCSSLETLVAPANDPVAYNSSSITHTPELLRHPNSNSI